MQLSSVTEERNRLKSYVDELKQDNNADAGSGIINKALLQVVQCNSYCKIFYIFFLDTRYLLLVLQGQELESSLVKKDVRVTELENNLWEQKEVNSRQHNEIKLLTERLNNEARRIKSLEREGDRLRSEISILESKVCS